MDRKNDSSKDITDLITQGAEILVLEENKKLKQQIDILNQKNARLEKLIFQLTSNELSADATDEEIICNMQLNKMKERVISNNNELDLDDVRKLEILIKNNRILKEDAIKRQKDVTHSLPDSKEELIKLAKLGIVDGE